MPEYQAARCYTYETARRMNLQQSGQRLHSDGVKLVAATMAKTIADRAIQVLGAMVMWGICGRKTLARCQAY